MPDKVRTRHSISNYPPNEKQVKRELREGKLTYIRKVTLSSDTSTSVQGDQFTEFAGTISATKVTPNVSNEQENAEGSADKGESFAEGKAEAYQMTALR